MSCYTLRLQNTPGTRLPLRSIFPYLWSVCSLFKRHLDLLQLKIDTTGSSAEPQCFLWVRSSALWTERRERSCHVLCCCEEGPLKLALILPFTKVVVLLSVNWCSRGHVPALTCPADARRPCLRCGRAQKPHCTSEMQWGGTAVASSARTMKSVCVLEVAGKWSV